MKIHARRFDQLTTPELYEILRCRTEVFVVEQNCVYQDMDEADKSSTHLFIEDCGRISAYLRVIDPGIKFPSASIGRVITMKPFRRQGLARTLMTEAIRLGLSLSDSIEIEAQAYLRNFYKSLGFIEISDEFILDGLPHIRMRLDQHRPTSL